MYSTPDRQSSTGAGGLPINADAIPKELRALRQWVPWRYETPKGKRTKVPINPANGRRARSNKPETWGTFDEALAACRRFNCAGVAFVFSPNDDYFGIDLDACRNPETGELMPWADEIVKRFATYTEVSPSGTGVKLIGRGTLPKGKGREKKLDDVKRFGDKSPAIEVYCQKRFFCLTGQHLPDSPPTCESRQEQLDMLLAEEFPPTRSTNGHGTGNGKPYGKWFDKLLSDCDSAPEGERSERDFALCAAACRRGCERNEVWQRVKTIGKFAVEGERYFNLTWDRAQQVVANQSLHDLRNPSARTDLANAKRLVALHGDKLRWCELWSKWLIWDGRRWAIDDSRTHELLAKDIVDRIWREVVKLISEGARDSASALISFAKVAASANGITNMLALARSEAGIPIVPNSLDCRPTLLNFTNGTLDLESGILSPHNRTHLITKIVPHDYVPDAKAPRWFNFLDTIFDHNARMIGFVQRLLGSSLRGEVVEHILPIFYGTGANGKTVLVETELHVVGSDYGCKGASDLLLAKRNDSHPTERADLHGKRVVFCVETDESRRLAEGLVKELTGGDTIKARRMREDFWSFKPSHTAFLVTNHKPEVRGTDHGLWRRLRLIPFTVTIPPHEQDKLLAEKLKLEACGILVWLVQGYMAWKRDGLDEPPEVSAATDAYRNMMDILTTFIDECCIVAPDDRVRASDLYSAYFVWARSRGERQKTSTVFGEAMTERGFQRRTSNGTWYHGIGLRANWNLGTPGTNSEY
jgi:putative DNA primase/helicase